MQTKQIICPKCRTVLNVKNSKNEEEKQITCPSCSTPLKVKFPPQQAPMEAKTFYAPPKKPVVDSGATQLAGADNGATQLAGGSYGATQLATPKAMPATPTPNPRLVFDEQPYFLADGQNIIGRKGTTSKATVQIATDDRYMSRQHCSITVTTLPDGSKKAVLSNYQNKNLTTIDGQEIETGDAIRLVNGNRIKMGHTTVIFKM